jgi:hypothetical protein
MTVSPPDPNAGFATQREQLTRSAVEFCLADLSMALTMLDVAATTHDGQTRRRNQRHARHALATVLHHLQRFDLQPKQRELVNAKVVELEQRLEQIKPG